MISAIVQTFPDGERFAVEHGDNNVIAAAFGPLNVDEVQEIQTINGEGWEWDASEDSAELAAWLESVKTSVVWVKGPERRYAKTAPQTEIEEMNAAALDYSVTHPEKSATDAIEATALAYGYAPVLTERDGARRIYQGPGDLYVNAWIDSTNLEHDGLEDGGMGFDGATAWADEEE